MQVIVDVWTSHQVPLMNQIICCLRTRVAECELVAAFLIQLLSYLRDEVAAPVAVPREVSVLYHMRTLDSALQTRRCNQELFAYRTKLAKRLLSQRWPVCIPYLKRIVRSRIRTQDTRCQACLVCPTFLPTSRASARP